MAEPKIEKVAGHFSASWGTGICRQYLQKDGGLAPFAHYFPTIAELQRALDKIVLQPAMEEAEVG